MRRGGGRRADRTSANRTSRQRRCADGAAYSGANTIADGRCPSLQGIRANLNAKARHAPAADNGGDFSACQCGCTSQSRSGGGHTHGRGDRSGRGDTHDSAARVTYAPGDGTLSGVQTTPGPLISKV
ncbi:MAG: hypothetical protein CMJ17_01100 [Phenylobacterium sp.]|nr:hypothetical protein [Phenylobacterium sp.]